MPRPYTQAAEGKGAPPPRCQWSVRRPPHDWLRASAFTSGRCPSLYGNSAKTRPSVPVGSLAYSSNDTTRFKLARRSA